MLRQRLARAATQRVVHNAAINTTITTTTRRAFSAGVGRNAEVEITIDGQKVMIEQVSNCRACPDGRFRKVKETGIGRYGGKRDI